MKHLQTFESFQMLNEEEIFGLGNMFKAAKDKAMKKAMDFLAKMTNENPGIGKKLDAAAADVTLSEKDKKDITSKASQSLDDVIPPKAQAEIESGLKGAGVQELDKQSYRPRFQSELILEKFDFKSVLGKILGFMGFGAQVYGFINVAIGMMAATAASGVGAAAAFTTFGITSLIAVVLIIAGFLISGKPWTVYLGIESQAQWSKKN